MIYLLPLGIGIVGLLVGNFVVSFLPFKRGSFAHILLMVLVALAVSISLVIVLVIPYLVIYLLPLGAGIIGLLVGNFFVSFLPIEKSSIIHLLFVVLFALALGAVVFMPILITNS